MKKYISQNWMKLLRIGGYVTLVVLALFKLNTPKTSIISKNGIIIEYKNEYELEQIISPLIIDNGKLISFNNSAENIKLAVERSNLLHILKNIRNF